MATPPVLVVESGPGEAPVSYKLSPGQELRPLSVSAVFDGTGAAGPWQPALSFYAKSGERLSTVFPQGVTLAPGEVAEVTFAPF